MTRRVVVAGGAGFIGSHLCTALLQEGEHVICIDNLSTGTLDNLQPFVREPRFDFIHHDVTRPLPMLYDVWAVIDLACPASPPHYQADPVHTLMTSVLGSCNLLELAGESRARFLLASTSEIYGDPQAHPQAETYNGNVNPTGPRACYDEGKRAAETLSYDFRRTRGLDVRVARIFNTYGPRMRADDGRLVSNVISQALSARDITIYGDGTQTRSFCYADDLIEGLVRLLEVKEIDDCPVNLGNPAEITVCRLVECVQALTRTRSRIVNRPLPVDDPRRRRPDITRARRLLGWSPGIPLEVGLRQTIEWFSSPAAPPAIARHGAPISEKQPVPAAPALPLRSGSAT